MGGRIYLLGILYAGPLITVEGKVVLHPSNPVSETDIPMNLGYVIKAALLLDFVSPLKVLHYKLGGT